MEEAGAASPPGDGDADVSAWERWYARLERWLPYVMLAFGTLVAVTPEGRTGTEQLVTVGLAVLAAGWVAVGHTTGGASRWGWPGAFHVYYVGLLALAWLLLTRDVVFFLFAITGFLHAAHLRPRPLVFLGTAATSFLIQAMTWEDFPHLSPAEAGGFVALLLLQTFLIGLGMVGSEKITEISEQRRRTVHRLETTLTENESLHEQLLEQARTAGVQAERQRMAREIHDTLAQGLTGVITQLEAAGQATHDEREHRRHLANAADLARQSLAEARRSVHALGPGALERGRLPDALDELARDWSDLHGVEAHVTSTGSSWTLPARMEVELLRVAQEALTNVAKHAGASRVGVTLSWLEDVVTLDVRDDGAGFTAGDGCTAGFGLTSMSQRVEELGGTLAIESTPGTGTAISATVPVATREAP